MYILSKLIIIPDFRLKAVTFDDVPWVITMKKNDHYFPTVELIKDAEEESGWRRISYEQGKAVDGEGLDGTTLQHDAAEPADGYEMDGGDCDMGE